MHIGLITILFLIPTLVLYPQDILKIMPLGDSITRGATGEPDDSGNSGYRKAFIDSLKSLGYRSSLEEGTDFDIVGSLTTTNSGSINFDKDHEGWSGWSIAGDTSGSLLNNVKTLLEYNPPDIILLHMGTNDITSNDNIENMMDEFRSLIDSIYDYDPNINIIVSKLINRIYPDSLVDSTRKFNDYIELMANLKSNSDLKLYIIDTGEEFIYQIDKSYPYYGDMWDTLHPNYSGYRKMAKTWFTKVKELLTPVLALPADNVNNISEEVTLSWFPALKANSYTVEVSGDPDFSNIIFEHSFITDTFYNLNGLSYNTDYYWRVSSKINTGSSPFSEIRNFKTSDPVAVDTDVIPGDIILYQNYPNPFNSSTTIKFVLNNSADVEVKIYDILGNKVDEISNGFVNKNEVIELSFNAGNLPSGIYLYEILVKGQKKVSLIKKMIMIK